MKFSTKELLHILGINRNRFQDWMDRGFIEPELQKSTKQGEPNLWSRDDMYRIWFFKYLLETGTSRREATGFYKWMDIDFTNVGPNEGQSKYLVCTRERMPGSKGSILGGEELREDVGTISLGKNQIYAVIINLIEIKEEVDSLIKG